MNQTYLYPGVWRLVAPNPSPLTGPGTNTYLIGGRQMIIVDPGPNDPTYGEAIVAALPTFQATTQAIVLTHHHPDHAGGADELARQLNVPLLSFGDPLRAGDEIKVDGLTLVVHHTPGHIYAHLCLWLAEQRLLLAGDLVAGQGTILVIPPDGDMAAYLDSLRAMLALAPAAILPGHGPVIEDAPALLQQYLDHRLRREQQVLELLAQGYTAATDIAAQIYADQPERLRIATLQVEAHLTKLRREGRV
jgi:glyoxylase-like metal-dependent hydrolase (beta-lactamase superfamily II)